MEARVESKATQRLRILARFAFFWGLAVFGRLTYLQIYQHDEFSRQAQSQQEREVEIEAPRGVIFDRGGQQLAMSLAVDSVCVNPLRIPDLDVAAHLLSLVLDDVDRQALLERLQNAVENRRGFMWVKRKITPEESEKLRSYKLDWVEFRTESRRFYPKGMRAAHLLGSVDHEEKGNAGIELALEKELAGRPGIMRTTSDVKGGVVDLQVFSDPHPGKNITLSVDERIQYVAERELEEAVKANRCTTGSLVVMDPNTGEILAMANYPSYDPNTPPAKGEPLSNRVNLAISSPFEPGSVFKVITIAAALETTRLRPTDVIACGNGKITLFKRVIHDHDPYSALSVSDVLAKSSNIGAIQIGLRVGDQRMYEYIRKFGFGKETGVPLPGESSGLVRRPEKWIPSSIGSIAMGHELSSTTVQLAQAASVVANGGMLVKPRLTLKRKRPGQTDDEPEVKLAPVRVLKPETAIKMRQMMEGVVLRGTGKKAQLDGYTAGGKTGSAQIYDFEARKYTHKYNASFMGFAPVNNPAVVVVVTLNGASQYGGAVAAPVFQKVASAALRILDVPKDLPDGARPPDHTTDVLSDLPFADLSDEPPASESAARPVQIAAARLPENARREMEEPAAAGVAIGPRAPDFQGKTLRDVLAQSTETGVPVQVSGTGMARNQFPAPGAVLQPGQAVRVVFAP